MYTGLYDTIFINSCVKNFEGAPKAYARNNGRVLLTVRLIHYLHVHIHKRQKTEQQHCTYQNDSR